MNFTIYFIRQTCLINLLDKASVTSILNSILGCKHPLINSLQSKEILGSSGKLIINVEIELENKLNNFS